MDRVFHASLSAAKADVVVMANAQASLKCEESRIVILWRGATEAENGLICDM